MSFSQVSIPGLFCIWSKSGHRRCSVKKVLLRNFLKFTEKHLCQNLFLIKLQAVGLLFSCEFYEISKTLFLKNTSERLLLSVQIMSVTEDLSNLLNIDLVSGSEEVVQMCSKKKLFWKISQIPKKTPIMVFLFGKVAD